jgi:hypothetical protein
MNITRRTTKVVIYQGDDDARLAELQERHEQAKAQRAAEFATGTRRGSPESPDPAPFKAALEDFITEAAERAEEIELEALGRRKFRELKAKHPARTEVGPDGETRPVRDDAPFGVNVTTFPDALLAFDSEPYRTIKSPVLTEDERAEFLDDIADGEFEKLWLTAYYLNTAAGGDPKLSLLSADLESSSSSSE